MDSSKTDINLNNLDVVDLDYDNLKTSFKNFLKGQSQFKDYDFDGPNMGTLLRLLAYNTYINAFYTNMALSESHLDSAQLRSSIISHAKDLNYVPRSTRSAVATVNCSFEASGASQPYTIQKGSLFSAVVKNTSYVFSIPESIVVSSGNNSFSFTTDIYEGFYLKDSYVFDGSSTSTYRITNKNVDTRSITVTVYENGSSIGDVYILSNTLLDLNNKSKAFFLTLNEEGYYEIYFGDNIIGRQPKNNSTVVIDYRISNGPLANGAKLFSMDFDPTGADELISTPLVSTIENAKNGQDQETDDSIRYYAPKSFQIQERTVVDSDYEIALKTAFPEINVITSYGGEEEDPPRMSKVIISADISNISGLPQSKIDEYTRFLKRRSPYGIDPIFKEPEYLYLDINSLVRYNVNITTNSAERIKTLVTNAIIAYNDIHLNDFKSQFRGSEFSRRIDNADASIVSNITSVRMYKKIPVTLGTPKNYVINFGLSIRDTLPEVGYSHIINREHAVKSSPFSYNGQTVQLEDTGLGKMRMVRREGDVHYEITKVGTVDYTTGTVNLSNLKIDSYSGTNFVLYAFPKDLDIRSNRNTLLLIEPAGINIKVEEIRE